MSDCDTGPFANRAISAWLGLALLVSMAFGIWALLISGCHELMLGGPSAIPLRDLLHLGR
jgi:hypothetical protein